MPEFIIKHRTDNLIELLSPMVGTFYWGQSEDGVSFGHLGYRIKKDQTPGFIEALKLKNEVFSPVDGKIVGIAVIDGMPVEFKHFIALIKTE